MILVVTSSEIKFNELLGTTYYQAGDLVSIFMTVGYQVIADA